MLILRQGYLILSSHVSAPRTECFLLVLTRASHPVRHDVLQTHYGKCVDVYILHWSCILQRWNSLLYFVCISQHCHCADSNVPILGH